MGKEEVAAALKKMVDDGDAADRMADDDFTDLADADLTQAERALVSAAAGEVPDVEGFGVGANYFEQQDDGTTRPLHRTIDDLRRSGYDVEVVESAVFPAEVITARLQQRLPDLVYGRHVAAVVRLSA